MGGGKNTEVDIVVRKTLRLIALDLEGGNLQNKKREGDGELQRV